MHTSIASSHPPSRLRRFGAPGSRWSILSWASLLSVASAASLLSLGSFASVLSIGSSCSVLSIGSSGSILSIGSSGSFLGVGRRGKPRLRATTVPLGRVVAKGMEAFRGAPA